MDLYEPLSSGEEEDLEPILPSLPPVISQVPYTPLDNTKNEIRLLQILPAQSCPSDISCQMNIYSLDDGPTYSALSYVWGVEHRTRRLIAVNGHLAMVTKNLFDALCRLREDRVERVWADAICIDQSNDQEKGHQVQKMGMIYQRASTVWSWTGPEDEDSKRGIQVMSRIAALARSLQLQSVLDPYTDGISLEQRKQVMEKVYGALSNDSWLKDGDLMLAFSLTHRDYWKRLWVIQEVCLARSVAILCGTSQISWDEVQRAMALFSWLQALSTYHPSGYSAFAANLSRISRSYGFHHWTPPPAVWVSARIRSKGKFSMQLFQLMDETCNDTILKASDPRDRIYALLGLVCEDDQKDTFVDYASPVPTVFVRATLLLLRRYGARVLMYSGLAHQRQGDGLLPSWAIDWSCTTARATGLLDNPMRDIPFLEPVRTVSNERLALRAAVRTRIVTCVAFFVFPDDITNLLERIQHLMLAQQLPSKDLVTLKRTVWRVLLHRRYPPSLSVQEVDSLFEEYLENATLTKFVQSIMPASPCNVYQSPPNLGQEKTALNRHSADQQSSYRFQDLLNHNKHSRSLFVTADGSIGSGPVMAEEGDVLCAFPECDVPFLLRREDGQEHDRNWKLVAPVYVDDMVSTEGDGYFTLKDFWATNPDVEEVVLS